MNNDRNRVYTANITQAGALLADTKTLLAAWSDRLSIDQNLRLAREQNIFAKNTRSWISQFLGMFRSRYLADDSTARALSTLVKGSAPAEILDPILYFYTARSDALLHDIIIDVLVPMRAEGHINVSTDRVQLAIRQWMAEGKMSSQWADLTVVKAAQKATAILRDFGLLQGKANKRFGPVYLPVDAIAFVAFVLYREVPSGARVVNHPDWMLFFLTSETVERLLIEAHQHHLLQYHSAGSVIRLSFPAETLEDYARVVLQRAP